MSTPFSKDDYDLAEDMFREVVEANVAEEDNLDAIREQFEARVNTAFERGVFIVEVKRLTVDHMWARVNDRAGKTTGAMVKEIVSGQIGMDLGAWLDQVVTVGKLRRTTIRSLGPTDWERIVAVRQENAERAAEALEQTERAARISIAAMSEYGDMEKAAPSFVHGPAAEDAA